MLIITVHQNGLVGHGEPLGDKTNLMMKHEVAKAFAAEQVSPGEGSSNRDKCRWCAGQLRARSMAPSGINQTRG